MPFFTGYLAQGVGSPNGFVENAASGYVRAAMSTTDLVSGSCSLATPVFVQSQTAAVITQRGLYDAPTGGNLIMWWNLSNRVTTTSTSIDRVRVGALSHTFPELQNGMGTGLQRVDFLAGRKIGTTTEGNPVISGQFIEVVNGVVAAKGTI